MNKKYDTEDIRETNIFKEMNILKEVNTFYVRFPEVIKTDYYLSKIITYEEFVID